MHYFLALILILQISCHRIQNSISVIRLDCGSEAILEGSYLRFADTAGNELRREDLDIRSLDGNESRRLEVTSKGCLSAQETGLWMVRHKAKLEGLVLEIKVNQLSNVHQLQDISNENLKLACLSTELSEAINPQDFLANKENQDLRGYAMHFSIREKQSDQFVGWPWLNLAATQPALVGTMIKEGEAILEIQLKNQFRLGETDKKSCAVRFDYTAPITYSSVQSNVPLQYRMQPFYVLDAEENLAFRSEDSDVSFYEVCWQKRSDWNVGEARNQNLARCSEVQKVDKDKNVNFSERKGYWQLDFRSVDKAGNRSQWSSPVIVLLEQTATIDGLKIKAAKLASIVEAKPVDGAASAMVLGMEMYHSWSTLPTQYERENMEGVVLLSLHRPWLRDSIRQDLVFQDVPDAMHWKNVWFDSGRKILSYERNRSNYDDRFIELKVYDTIDYSEKSLLKLDWEYLSNSIFFETSTDEKRFVFGVPLANKIWAGNLIDNDIRLTEIEFANTPLLAKFVEDDSRLVVVTDFEKITYDVNNLLGQPIQEVKIPSESALSELSHDGRYLLKRDWTQNVMTWIPLLDEGLPNIEINITQSGLTEAEVKAFYVVGPNRYLIPVMRDVIGPCVYLLASLDSSGELGSRRIAEGAPCDGDLVLNKSQSSALLNLDTERVGALLMGNLNKFSKAIPFPVQMEVDGGAESSFGSTSKATSDNGEYVATTYPEGEDNLIMAVWRRDEKGDYQQYLKTPVKWPAFKAPVIFAEDLGLIVTFDSGFLQMVGYMTSNKDVYDEYTPVECDMVVTGAYIGRGKLLVACLGGHVDILDISTNKFRYVGHSRPTQTTITHMHYDMKNEELLMAVKDSTQLWLWPKGDLNGSPRTLGGFKSGIINVSISRDSAHLATISASKENSSIKVFDYKNIYSSPAFLEGHSAKVSHLSFFGSHSLLVSGDESGTLKIWDAKHPDFPGVTLLMQRGGAIKNLVGIPDRNEFIAENSSQRIFHYRLETLQEITKHTCAFLRPYVNQNSGLTDTQKKLCDGVR